MNRLLNALTLLGSLGLGGCEFGMTDGPIRVELVASSLEGSVCHVSAQSNFTCCQDSEVPFDLAGECRDAVSGPITDSVDAARNAGLTYDAHCVDEVLRGTGCMNLESGTFASCEQDCQIFHGQGQEAAPCIAYGHRMSDCAQGLICAPDGSCHQPCDYDLVAPAGGYCGPARGMWFVTCAAGLACSSEGLCEPGVALGDSCAGGLSCAVGGWCEPQTEACVADLPDGTTCTEHEQCASKVCKQGACLAPDSPTCGRWAW